MFFFISGAEIVFIFFVVLLIFGADKIPSIAKLWQKESPRSGMLPMRSNPKYKNR